MAYSNQYGRNPIMMSNNIEIRSGTAINGEAVADEYVALGYEPALGTQYLSTVGQVFIHHKVGIVANTWYKVTDAPEPDMETFSVTTTLTPALQPISIRKQLTTAAVSLASSIKQAISKKLGVTINLGASVLYWVSSWDVSVGLSVAGELIKSIVRQPFSVTANLSASRIIGLVKSRTITLSGVMTKLIELHRTQTATITLAPSNLVSLVITPKAGTVSLGADCIISINP